MKVVSTFFRGLRSTLRPPDRRPNWQWCEENVSVDDTSPIPGRWRADNSPWVLPVMEAAQDPAVRFVSVKCSAQSAKTQVMLNLACWVIAEDPGPSLWVMAAKDEVRDFIRDRAGPTLRKCRPVAASFVSKEGTSFSFVAMPFYFTGAGSPSKLQSKPIRWLFLDEVRNYPAGALELALKRVRSYWNSKVFIISTPNLVGDDVEMHFRLGSQESFHLLCPRCGLVQPLLFDGLKWEPVLKEDGTEDEDATAETIRLNCSRPGCAHFWRDTPFERRLIAKQGRFVAGNPGAPKHRRSFHWNALLPFWVPWRSIVEEFRAAIASAKADPPDIEPLKSFYTETLGLSWEEALGVIDDFDFLEERKADYAIGEAWGEEITRMMAADKQAAGGEHYFWVIRAFGLSGKSRLIAYGRAETLDELEEIRKTYNVPLKNAVMDAGYEPTAVFRWSQRSGWKAFRGDSVDLYTVGVPDERTGEKKTVRRLWSRVEVDPTFGFKRRPGRQRRLIPLFRFADETTKDFLGEHMRGLVGDWTIPRDVGRDYIQQLTAEVRTEQTDRRGRVTFKWVRRRKSNHFFDCEKMILVAAVIARLIQSGAVRVGRPAASPPSTSSPLGDVVQPKRDEGDGAGGGRQGGGGGPAADAH